MQTTVQVVHKHDPSLELDVDSLAWLTEHELARYQSISASLRKQQFLAGHFLVRKLAARSLGNRPEDWSYFHDDDDLRRLKCSDLDLPIPYVSISHAGDWIAAAVSSRPVGIDIETFLKDRDFIAIASHVFSTPEVEILKTCKPGDLKRTFYLYWTLKESIAKQFSSGLKFELSRRQSAMTAAESTKPDMQSWLCSDYVVALAGDSPDRIETNGLCESAIHQRWQNVSA